MRAVRQPFAGLDRARRRQFRISSQRERRRPQGRRRKRNGGGHEHTYCDGSMRSTALLGSSCSCDLEVGTGSAQQVGSVPGAKGFSQNPGGPARARIRLPASDGRERMLAARKSATRMRQRVSRQIVSAAQPLSNHSFFIFMAGSPNETQSAITDATQMSHGSRS